MSCQKNQSDLCEVNLFWEGPGGKYPGFRFRIMIPFAFFSICAETHLRAPLYLLVLHALELGEGLYRPPWKLRSNTELKKESSTQWNLAKLGITLQYSCMTSFKCDNLTSTLWHLCIRHIRRLWGSWWLTSLLVLCRTRRSCTLLGLKFVCQKKGTRLMYVSWHGHNDHQYPPDYSPSWKRDHNIESHTNGPLALDRMRVACIRGWRSSKMLWSEKVPSHIASRCPRIPAKKYTNGYGKARCWKMNRLARCGWTHCGCCGCHGGSNQYIVW